MSHTNEHDHTQHALTITKRRDGEAEPYEVIHVPLPAAQQEEEHHGD